MTGFEQIVFSGGGTRCFWQGGFLEVVSKPLGLDPARITGVSGGAMAAAAWIAGRERLLYETMTDAFADQEGNMPWHTRDEASGITPHQRIYREVVNDVIDATAQKIVADGPSFQVLLAHPPFENVALAGSLMSTLIYELELHLRGDSDGSWAQQAGLTSTLVDAREAARQGRLAHLVDAAATIPPVFDLSVWDDKVVIDGGMASQTPMPQPDEGRTLILVTRHYDTVPQGPQRVVVEPSADVPADKIDFTDPGKIRRSWDLGERDGRSFLEDGDTTT